MIYVIATFRLHPGRLEAFVQAAYALIDTARREPGCIYYDLHASVTDPERVLCLEQWTDRAIFDHHFSGPHQAIFREAIKDHVLTSKVEIIHPAQIDVL